MGSTTNTLILLLVHDQLRSEDVFTRLRVRDALSKAPAKLLVPQSDQLAECLNDPDPFLRRTSLSILSKLPPPSLVPFVDLIVVRLEDEGMCMCVRDRCVCMCMETVRWGIEGKQYDDSFPPPPP